MLSRHKELVHYVQSRWESTHTILILSVCAARFNTLHPKDCRAFASNVTDAEWESYPILDITRKKLYSRALYEDKCNFVSLGSSIESFADFVNKRLEAQALKVRQGYIKSRLSMLTYCKHGNCDVGGVPPRWQGL